MSIAENNSYLIVDKEKNPIGEILSVKKVENWYTGKVKNLSLPEKLDFLFQEVEKHIKNQDFSATKKAEEEILDHKTSNQRNGSNLQ